MTFDRSRIGLTTVALRKRHKYSEDGNLSDDIADNTSWEQKRGSKPSDLSEVLRKSRSKNSGRNGAGLRSNSEFKIQPAVVKPEGIKSRLGELGGQRKRRLDTGSGISTSAMAKRSLSGPSLGIAGNLKKNIIKTVRENEKRVLGSSLIKHETFIEQKTKTGDAIDWDSKLSRPRFGMVADMADQRVSAKSRIKNGGGEDRDVIKRTVPNVKNDSVCTNNFNEKNLERNVVMTEVIEEEFEDFNILKTVENDYEMEETDEEGFFEDRVIKTRDKLTEIQIKKQKERSEQHNHEDLENDDGRDLPDWNDKVLIEVANNEPERDPTPPPIFVSSSSIASRPKLEAKRNFESRKSKQIREVRDELKEIEELEKKKEAKKKRERQLREEEEALRKEKEDIERRKRVETEKRKSEDEKKRKDIEKQKQEEAKLEALRRKNEQLKLEQELKKREEALKIEEEERKIKELQRQEEVLKKTVQEKQKEVEKQKKELERVKQAKQREQEDEIIEAQRKKIENDSRIKKEIKAIEEQEKQIRDRQKQLQKRKHEKKREIKSRSKKKRSRRYSSEESSSSDSEDSDSNSESSSSESESETSLSESEDSEYERKQKKGDNAKHSKSKSKSSKTALARKSHKDVSASSGDATRRRETRETKRPEASKSGSKERRRPGGGGSSKDGIELHDKLKSYLNRAKSVGPK